MSALFRLNEKYWPLLVLALLAIVTIASLSPHMPVPGVMSSDKLRHFLSYAAIAGPIALARPRGWAADAAGPARLEHRHRTHPALCRPLRTIRAISWRTPPVSGSGCCWRRGCAGSPAVRPSSASSKRLVFHRPERSVAALAQDQALGRVVGDHRRAHEGGGAANDHGQRQPVDLAVEREADQLDRVGEGVELRDRGTGARSIPAAATADRAPRRRRTSGRSRSSSPRRNSRAAGSPRTETARSRRASCRRGSAPAAR